MKLETIYRILTYILLPFAALFAFIDFFGILAALAQPAILISVFIIGCIVTYTYTCFRFLINGIDRAKPCKHSLKDLIKVNAYVSLVFVAMSYFQIYLILSQPNAINTFIVQFITQQQTNLPPGTSTETFVLMIKSMLYFLAFYATILLAHVVNTFRLLKKYNHVFDAE